MRGVTAAGVLVALMLFAAPVYGAELEAMGRLEAVQLQGPARGDRNRLPHPDADPFCVDFDKTHQNLTQLGVVDFLLNEPARVAAASTKCFYYQRDHWTGYVVQGDRSTETYHWDGDYFFNKATGAGGVHVDNFSFHGQTADPTTAAGLPRPPGSRYFGPGRGGVEASAEVPADPACGGSSALFAPFAGLL